MPSFLFSPYRFTSLSPHRSRVPITAEDRLTPTGSSVPVGPTALRVLGRVRAVETCSVAEAATSCGLPLGAALVVVSELERAGLVRVSPAEAADGGAA